ncbi:hypothetical protein [Roseovarius pelagicus]|uniref:Uncharacterized protein n=1 Tax=Roseovarius pelagicus TaxID=2980108 RepID=A0ABY6DC54_9RHOB|nr:hypothetical protein [Roseovarius pelagicus]UXX83145.1 hypothetical protein N7U68_19040 [Roseovarius pelagicus]
MPKLLFMSRSGEIESTGMKYCVGPADDDVDLRKTWCQSGEASLWFSDEYSENDENMPLFC